MKSIFYFLSILLSFSVMISCSSKSTKTEPTIPIVVKPTPTPQIPSDVADIPLYWENTTAPHPERQAWSAVVIAGFREYKSIFDKASDVTDICPKYKTLTPAQQLKALGEFWVAVAYYESGFNPLSESVDVGTKNNKESWSVGLYQLSGVDKVAKKFGANYEQLKNPLVNIGVSIEQLKWQVETTGKFMLPNSSSSKYWSVTTIGNKNSKVSEIKARTLKYAPLCK